MIAIGLLFVRMRFHAILERANGPATLISTARIVASRFIDALSSIRAEYHDGPFQQLRLPLRDLVRVNVKLLRPTRRPIHHDRASVCHRLWPVVCGRRFSGRQTREFAVVIFVDNASALAKVLRPAPCRVVKILVQRLFVCSMVNSMCGCSR
jgi:hypothetical protein